MQKNIVIRFQAFWRCLIQQVAIAMMKLYKNFFDSDEALIDKKIRRKLALVETLHTFKMDVAMVIITTNTNLWINVHLWLLESL